MELRYLTDCSKKRNQKGAGKKMIYIATLKKTHREENPMNEKLKKSK